MQAGPQFQYRRPGILGSSALAKKLVFAWNSFGRTRWGAGSENEPCTPAIRPNNVIPSTSYYGGGKSYYSQNLVYAKPNRRGLPFYGFSFQTKFLAPSACMQGALRPVSIFVRFGHAGSLGVSVGGPREYYESEFGLYVFPTTCYFAVKNKEVSRGTVAYYEENTVVGTFDGVNKLSIYVNGSGPTTSTQTPFYAAVDNYVWIGYPGSVNQATYEVLVWHRELQPKEALSLHQYSNAIYRQSAPTAYRGVSSAGMPWLNSILSRRVSR
jgi:hypothetical protein